MKLHQWLITDLRTGHETILRARSRKTLDHRLGKRADEVLICRLKGEPQ